jgi:hypothetical protein
LSETSSSNSCFVQISVLYSGYFCGGYAQLQLWGPQIKHLPQTAHQRPQPSQIEILLNRHSLLPRTPQKATRSPRVVRHPTARGTAKANGSLPIPITRKVLAGVERTYCLVILRRAKALSTLHQGLQLRVVTVYPLRRVLAVMTLRGDVRSHLSMSSRTRKRSF